jgi:HEAT repeat protein
MASSKGMIALAVLMAGAGVGFAIGVFCPRGERAPTPLAIPTEGLTAEMKQMSREMAQMREQTARLEEKLLIARKQPEPEKREQTYKGKPLSHWLMLLEDADWVTRDEGVAAVTEIGPRARAALPTLVRFMIEDGISSEKLAKAIVSIDRTHELLRACLKDKDYRKRRDAALILGCIDTPEWPGLAAYHSYADDSVYQPAFLWKEEHKAHHQAEDRVAIPVLIEALNDRQKFPERDRTTYCEIALERLVSFGPEARAAIPALCSLMTDRDPSIRSAVAQTLGSIGTDAKAAIPLLLAALRDLDIGVRGGAILGLGGIGVSTPQVMAALKAALKDKEKSIRAAAAEGMAGMKGSAEELVGVLRETMVKDPDHDVKIEAMKALGRFGSAAKPAVPALLQIVSKDSNRDMRCTAYRVLERIAPEEAKGCRSPFKIATPTTPSPPDA